MIITKQIHEFIRKVFIENKPIQMFNFPSQEFEDVTTNIFNSKFKHEYDLRITPDIKYWEGDRFVDLKGNQYLLIKDNMIDYYDDDVVIVHNTFYLMLLFNCGSFHSKKGESVTVKNKNYITQEQFKFLSNKQINTKELVKI